MAQLNEAPKVAQNPHEMRVLSTLREHGALTRAELSDKLKLSRTTLSELSTELLQRGAIVEFASGAPRLGRGRPATVLALDPQAGQFIGVDFGHRRVRCVIANAAHQIIASSVAEYAIESDWPARIDIALTALRGAAHDEGVHLEAVHGVGIGFPGPFSPRLPHAEEEPIAVARRLGVQQLKLAFREAFNTEVIVDNNTRLAGLAEAIWDAPVDIENLMYVRLSDGIGGGVVAGGQLLAGGFGFAGEFGHICVAGETAPCRCGKRGCLETVAGKDAILDKCRARGVEVATLEHVAVRAATGDPVVLTVLREVGNAVGHVLGGAAMVLNPGEIVIGGEVAELSPVILEQAAATIRFELLPVSEGTPTVRGTRLGDEAGAIGAVAALFHSSSILTTYPRIPVPAQSRQRSTTVHVSHRKDQQWPR